MMHKKKVWIIPIQVYGRLTHTRYGFHVDSTLHQMDTILVLDHESMDLDAIKSQLIQTTFDKICIIIKEPQDYMKCKLRICGILSVYNVTERDMFDITTI